MKTINIILNNKPAREPHPEIIRTEEGAFFPVDAHEVGSMAVHRPLTGGFTPDVENWNITHRRTGRAAMIHLRGRFNSVRRIARGFDAIVERLGEFDANQANTTNPTWKAMAEYYKLAIRRADDPWTDVTAEEVERMVETALEVR